MTSLPRKSPNSDSYRASVACLVILFLHIQIAQLQIWYRGRCSPLHNLQKCFWSLSFHLTHTQLPKWDGHFPGFPARYYCQFNQTNRRTSLCTLFYCRMTEYVVIDVSDSYHPSDQCRISPVTPSTPSLIQLGASLPVPVCLPVGTVHLTVWQWLLRCRQQFRINESQWKQSPPPPPHRHFPPLPPLPSWSQGRP